MTNAARIRDAYAVWNSSKAADPAIWDAFMGPDFEFRTTMGSIPNSGFKECYGREEVADYFNALSSGFEMKTMTPTLLVEDGDNVMGVLDANWVNRATGRSFQCEVACIWTFDGDKVTRYRELLDTAAVARTLPSAPPS